MALEVREGGKVDVQQLEALYQNVPWAQGRSVEGIRKMLENTDFIFSAWDGSKLVGFARVLTDRIYRATLWDVVVHPDYRGKGVGDSIMKTVLAHPVLSKIPRFWLNTRDKHAYYERFGFERSDQGMILKKTEGGDA